MGTAADSSAVDGSSSSSSPSAQSGTDTFSARAIDIASIGASPKGGADWSGMNGKSIGTVNDVIITHQISMVLMNTDKAYKERLLQTADRLVKMVKTMDNREFGMDEYYDNDWNLAQAQETTMSGNLLKPSLCLAMAYTIEARPEYKEASKKLEDEI